MTTAQPDSRVLDLLRLLDPMTRVDPYPVFRALREHGPFPAFDGAVIVVGEHERCATILRDPEMSSDRRRTLIPRKLPDEDGRAVTSFMSMDPPDHTRLRRLVFKAFTPRAVAELESTIRRIVDELLSAVARSGSLDVVHGFAYPLSVRIIAEMLGIPESGHHRFEAWSRSLGRGLDPSPALTGKDIADVRAAQNEIRKYFGDLIAVRRAKPGKDLLSRLIQIEEQGDQLSEAELISTCVLLLVAGHETTANLIAGAILALLRNPDQLAALRSDPSLIAGTVEEALRFDTPVQLINRIVRKPTIIGDVEAPADSMLLLLLGAANRDPAAFVEPDRFDITRDSRGHLSFAAGPHFCLGAGLARLESTIALQAFADRVVDPELDEESVIYRPHVTQRGPQRLVVRFDGVR
jgi:cytochrome P450